MDNDDRQVGRILSRREVLALFGAAGAAMLVARASQIVGLTQPVEAVAQATAVADPAHAVYLPLVSGPTSTSPTPTATLTPTATAGTTPTATLTPTAGTTPTGTTVVPACVVQPAETEGPYFVDEHLKRSDIRSDPTTGEVKEGVLLQLTFVVSQISGSGCTPISGLTVDLWQCDAAGQYSDESDPSFNTVGQKWLRGYQVTDANGVVQFTTIYPGWYSGRTVHQHFKIRTDPSSTTGYEFTSQLFFDDSLTDQVFTQQPYASKGQRDTRNSTDNVYQNGGDQLLLSLTQTAQGYAATFDIALRIT